MASRADEVTRLTTDEGELAATREEAVAAAAAGIDGVPLFVFGERLAVAGAQPEIVLRNAIEQASLAFSDVRCGPCSTGPLRAGKLANNRGNPTFVGCAPARP